MNILIVTQYFWPELFRINDLASGLAERGHNVTVLTGKPNYPGGNFFPGYSFLGQKQELYGQVKVIRSPLVPRGKGNLLRLAINYCSFVVFASMMALYRCKQQDVIFVYEPSPITVGLPALLIKKFKKIPILFWVQDLWPESLQATGAVRSPKLLKMIESLVRYIYRGCDLILTTSTAFFEPIKKLSVRQEKIRFFPQSAEAVYQPIEKDEAVSENKLLPEGFRIIFAGNIGIAQDVETILEASKILKAHKAIKLILLGDGSKRAWLQEQIIQHKLDETVFWLGQHPLEKMPLFFACADGLLVTLKKDPLFSLTIPAKIQSYFACAKPVIASLEGEGANIVQDAGAGICVLPGDPQALAAAILKLYAMSSAEREFMGKSGRVFFEKHFDRDVLLNKLENWINEVARKKGNE